MIAWMNENSGALMVVITFIYVVATVLICIFNWKSAKTSREQISTSQIQQEQNVGLQLYSMRKEVVNKIANQKYNDVKWDVSLLFDHKIFDEFKSIVSEAEILSDMEMEVQLFEDELKILFSNRKEIIDSKIVLTKINKEYNELKEFIIRILNEESKKEPVINSVDEYIEKLKQIDELRRAVNEKTRLFIQKLRCHIRNSIKIEKA